MTGETRGLDPWHVAAVERAMAGDRARVAAGERQFVRIPEPHEFCVPGACITWPTLVAVTAVAGGLRARVPLGPEAVRA